MATGDGAGGEGVRANDKRAQAGEMGAFVQADPQASGLAGGAVKSTFRHAVGDGVGVAANEGMGVEEAEAAIVGGDHRTGGGVACVLVADLAGIAEGSSGGMVEGGGTGTELVEDDLEVGPTTPWVRTGAAMMGDAVAVSWRL
jgi:hypothetical protein